MNRLKLRDSLEDISYLIKSFEKFKRQANISVIKIKTMLEDNKLSTSEIVNNSFDFTFWGLSFTIKAEIEYDSKCT